MNSNILFFATVISLFAAACVNAGLVQFHEAPNDLSDLSEMTAVYSTPNDLPDFSYTEFFAGVPAPNEKIAVAVLTFSDIKSRTRERDERLFINLRTDNNLEIRRRLLSKWAESLVSKTQRYNINADFNKFEFWNTFKAYNDTLPDTDKNTSRIQNRTQQQ
jgi:hypothetical protein